MIFVTADLHGRMDCLQKLLDKARFYDDEENWLYILGDVIDRNGRGGVDILKWLLLMPNAQLLLGNHEQMLLANRWLFREITEESADSISDSDLLSLQAWESNGAACTIRALTEESPETREDILEYLADCPLTESVSVNGKNYLLVHSGLGNYEQGKRLRDYTEDELLWTRPELTTSYHPELFTVILGHTPTEAYAKEYANRMIQTESFWNIDTGAALPHGRPMLLCLDTQRAYYIEPDGSVIEQ